MCNVMSIGQSVKAFEKLGLVSSSKFDDHEKTLKSIMEDFEASVDGVSKFVVQLIKDLQKDNANNKIDIDRDKKGLQGILKTAKEIVSKYEEYSVLYDTKLYFKADIDEFVPEAIEKINTTLENLYMLVEDLELGLKHGKQFEKLAILMDEYVSKAPTETIEVKDLFD